MAQLDVLVLHACNVPSSCICTGLMTTSLAHQLQDDNMHSLCPALPCPALPRIKASSDSMKPCVRLLMACIQAQAEAQQAADDLDDSETIDSRQGSLSSRRPKTPRCEGGQSPAPSPNARSRKMRKSARDKDFEDGEPALYVLSAALPVHCG